jgi:hypothetical protein
MIETWILVSAGLAVIAVLLSIAIVTRREPAGVQSAIALIRSIDIDAFRNLVDPDEEQFLRENLPPSQFRAVKRERARAALAYVRSTGQAAAVFARAAQAAQRSTDPEIAESGTQIARSALLLRLYSIRAGVRLAGEVILPISRPSDRSVIDQYERTADALLRLGRQQRDQRTYAHV